MPERIYKLSYPANPNRPIWFDDAGNLLLISGFILQGMDATVVMYMPNANPVYQAATATPTLEQWCAFLARSDDPLIFEQDETGTIKAIHRKVQRAISGAIQQRIWHRDGWQCMYCGKRVPDIQITVDHFHPLELGGADEASNYISACRQCQKAKGNRLPQEYCQSNKLDYDGLCDYLAGKASKLFINHLDR